MVSFATGGREGGVVEGRDEERRGREGQTRKGGEGEGEDEEAGDEEHVREKVVDWVHKEQEDGNEAW